MRWNPCSVKSKETGSLCVLEQSLCQNDKPMAGNKINLKKKKKNEEETRKTASVLEQDPKHIQTVEEHFNRTIQICEKIKVRK